MRLDQQGRQSPGKILIPQRPDVSGAKSLMIQRHYLFGPLDRMRLPDNINLLDQFTSLESTQSCAVCQANYERSSGSAKDQQSSCRFAS